MSSANTVKVGEAFLGGAVGEYPTAVLGTLFFSGQNLLIDSEQGIFDEASALDQIRRAEKATVQTGVSLFLDIVAETAAAMKNYLYFIIKNTSLPFLIDASSDEVRVAGIEIAQKHSALERAVYNSMGPDTSKEELDIIERYTPAAIVVSAMDPMDFGATSALAIIEQIKESLPDRIHDRLLVDIGFLDEASVRTSANLAQKVREHTGYPVGGAPCNGIYMWESLKNQGEEAVRSALSATLGYVAAFGLDFLFVGPLRNVEHIAPAIGAADVYNRYELQSGNYNKSLPKRHPMKVMFS